MISNGLLDQFYFQNNMFLSVIHSSAVRKVSISFSYLYQALLIWGKWYGTVRGNCYVKGTVRLKCFFKGTAQGNCYVKGTVQGKWYVKGTVRGKCFVKGTVRGNCYVKGTVVVILSDLQFIKGYVIHNHILRCLIWSIMWRITSCF